MRDSKECKMLHTTKRKVKSQAYLKYQRYIRSRAFKEIRELILTRDDYQCQVCNWRPSDGGNRTLSVHHRTYEHLYAEKEHLEDLICLCSVCHKAIHMARSNYNRFKEIQ